MRHEVSINFTDKQAGWLPHLRPSLVRTPERMKILVGFARSIGSDSIDCRSKRGKGGKQKSRGRNVR